MSEKSEKSAIMRWCEKNYPLGGYHIIVYRKVIARNANGEPRKWKTDSVGYSHYGLEPNESPRVENPTFGILTWFYWNGKSWMHEYGIHCDIYSATAEWTLKKFLRSNNYTRAYLKRNCMTTD